MKTQNTRQGTFTIEFWEKVPENIQAIAGVEVEKNKVTTPFTNLTSSTRGFTLRILGEPYFLNPKNLRKISGKEGVVWEAPQVKA